MSDHSEWLQRIRALLTNRRAAVVVAVVILVVPVWFAIPTAPLESSSARLEPRRLRWMN